jgi:hypothetical protein
MDKVTDMILKGKSDAAINFNTARELGREIPQPKGRLIYA